MSIHSGSCLCGAVKYEIRGDLDIHDDLSQYPERP